MRDKTTEGFDSNPFCWIKFDVSVCLLGGAAEANVSGGNTIPLSPD